MGSSFRGSQSVLKNGFRPGSSSLSHRRHLLLSKTPLQNQNLPFCAKLQINSLHNTRMNHLTLQCPSPLRFLLRVPPSTTTSMIAVSPNTTAFMPLTPREHETGQCTWTRIHPPAGVSTLKDALSPCQAHRRCLRRFLFLRFFHSKNRLQTKREYLDVNPSGDRFVGRRATHYLDVWPLRLDPPPLAGSGFGTST